MHPYQNAIRTALLVGILVAGRAGVGRADEVTLVVTQDENAMQRVIEQNLTQVHKLTVNEQWTQQKHLWLDLPRTSDPLPAYRSSIDTQWLKQDDAGKVTEQGVRVLLYTNVKVPANKQPALLRIINDFNRDKVFSSAYLDTDGEIVFDWTLEVGAKGLPIEYVFDVLSREDTLWRELWPLVSAALQ
jgi:hypothetical protein